MTSLDPLSTLFLRHLRIPLASSATRAHCWLVANLVLHQVLLYRAPSPAGQPSANLLRVDAIPLFRLLMKMLHNNGPITDLWGRPLVTGLQIDSVPLITSLWAPPVSQFSFHFSIQISIPLFLCLPTRTLWGAESRSCWSQARKQITFHRSEGDFWRSYPYRCNVNIDNSTEDNKDPVREKH